MEQTYAISEDQAKQRRMEAVFSHEEAKDERARLILEAKALAARYRKIASLLDAIEVEPEFPLQSEAALLALSSRDYEGIGFETTRGLANSIAASRKKVADAAEVRRIHRG
jgi:hypothetical protein